MSIDQNYLATENLSAPQGSGWDAINNPIPTTGPFVIKKLVVGPDGRITTVTVDARTGLEMPADTPAFSSVNYYGDPPEKEKTTAEKILEPEKDPEPAFRPSDQSRGERPEISGSQSPSGPPSNRGLAVNNYGYIDKPAGLGLLSLAPGPVGIAGKVVNGGINANNVHAVNQARHAMELPSLSGMEAARGLMRDRQGQVANVSIKDDPEDQSPSEDGTTRYSVGFEAQSPTGQTNLTPNEARIRGLTLGGLTETPKALAKEDTKAFQKSFPDEKKGNIAQRAYDIAKSFVADMFGDVVADTGTPNRPDTDSSNKRNAAEKEAVGDRERMGVGVSDKERDRSVTRAEKNKIDNNRESSGGGNASRSEAGRGGGGVSSGGRGLW